MYKTGPREDDTLAVEGRAAEEDCVFKAAFCYGEIHENNILPTKRAE